MFGPDLGNLKGKRTRQTAPQVVSWSEYVKDNYLTRHKNVTLGSLKCTGQ